jgi:hypothetical protein
MDLLSETTRAKFGNDEEWERIASLKRMIKKP